MFGPLMAQRLSTYLPRKYGTQTSTANPNGMVYGTCTRRIGTSTRPMLSAGIVNVQSCLITMQSSRRLVMVDILSDINTQINGFHRGQLKKAWLDILVDENGKERHMDPDEKHNKIKELLDNYWKYIV